MQIAFQMIDEMDYKKPFSDAYNDLTALLSTGDPSLASAVCWALAWIGYNSLVNELPNSELLKTLFTLWRRAKTDLEGRYSAWALSSLPIADRGTLDRTKLGDCSDFLNKYAEDEGHDSDIFRRSALIMGWYLKTPWSDAELAQRLMKSFSGLYKRDKSNLRVMLSALGEPGIAALKQLDKKKERTSLKDE